MSSPNSEAGSEFIKSIIQLIKFRFWRFYGGINGVFTSDNVSQLEVFIQCFFSVSFLSFNIHLSPFLLKSFKGKCQFYSSVNLSVRICFSLCRIRILGIFSFVHLNGSVTVTYV